MRNVFDQYRHHENRLTHALVSSLAADPALLRSFVEWALDERITATRAKGFTIVEQRLPGHAEVAEDEAVTKGLPDAWLYDEEGWSLVIESKISSSVNIDQLIRHIRVATQRGYPHPKLLLLTTSKGSVQLPRNSFHKTWPEVYQWAFRHCDTSEWARILVDFMEIAEGRMTADEYLIDGTLTMFSGIGFDDKNPYTYLEAKRVLKLIMEELRKDKTLAASLGADLKAAGRSAITGSEGTLVWDFIPLKSAADARKFTEHPHLTFCIAHDSAVVQLTVPNGVAAGLRNALLAGGFDAFKDTLIKLAKANDRVLKMEPKAQPYVAVLQRHFPIRHASVTDAQVEFDPRTVRGAGGKGNSRSVIKPRDEWAQAAYGSLVAKRGANLELGVGFRFAYRNCISVRKREFVNVIAEVWQAQRAILMAMKLI
ncbi:MAG TPA: hypothetical protein VLI46_13580 [Ramlibacter sp.]|nr:hypothetical protein [Ramlibacter sp.]